MCEQAQEYSDGYMTVQEIVKQMHSSDDTVRRMIKSGDLEAVEWRGAYRVKRASFQHYLETHRVQANGSYEGIRS